MKNANMMPAGKDRPERKVTRVPLIAPLPQRKKVAAYARVSVEKDASLHSLAAQISHYSSLIQSRRDWEYAGVYADEGLSGTKANRPEIQRLLQDCRAGKIDMVLVKAISRFARNTVTMLETVRELKTLGIDVYFEKENIHSMSGDGELMLTILASFAQAEAESVSENCRWRIKKNFESGIPVGVFMYGYKMKNGTFTIIPEEAEIIRLIFKLFLEGMGRVAIANYLNQKGVPAPEGGKWHPGMLYFILRNEKYVGDLVLQKYYTKDYLTKKKMVNHGERPFYFIDDNHEGILDHGVFDQVQLELERRAAKYNPGKNDDEEDALANLKRADGKYLFSGKIVCGVCGKPFCRKKANAGTEYSKAAWTCGQYAMLGKKGCASRRIPERVLIPITAQLLKVPEEELPEAISRVEIITVFPTGTLKMQADGNEEEVTWASPSRRDSWDEKKRQQASDRMKETWKRRKAR